MTIDPSLCDHPVVIVEEFNEFGAFCYCPFCKDSGDIKQENMHRWASFESTDPPVFIPSLGRHGDRPVILVSKELFNDY